MKRKILLGVCILFAVSLFAEKNPGVGMGADAAYPTIEGVLKTMEFKDNEVSILKTEDLEKLIETSAEIEINIFELFDCLCRYLSAHQYRVRIDGSSLLAMKQNYVIDERMIQKLLPIDELEYVETGSCFTDEQNALDIFLRKEVQRDLEIGIGLYQKHFGFKKMEPLLFSKCFGLDVRVKVLNLKMKVSKLHLCDRGKGAFYVKGFYRPKRWYLLPIKKITLQESAVSGR